MVTEGPAGSSLLPVTCQPSRHEATQARMEDFVDACKRSDGKHGEMVDMMRW